MVQSAEEVVRFIQSAYISGDYDSLYDLLSESIVYHLPDHNPFAGTYQGISSVINMLRKVREHSRRVNTASFDVFTSCSSITVAVRQRRCTVLDNEPLEWMQDTLYFLSNGKVQECWGFANDYAGYDRYWSYGEPANARDSSGVVLPLAINLRP